MPGVLLIEAMAQTSGWLLIAVTRFTRMPFFVAVKEAKLRSFVTPGQQLALSATLLHEGSGFAVTRAEVRCNDRSVCNVELTCRLMEFPNPEFRANMKKILTEIQTGQFATEWVLENQAGRPTYSKLLDRDKNHPIEAVGKELRAQMSWIKPETAAAGKGKK